MPNGPRRRPTTRSAAGVSSAMSSQRPFFSTFFAAFRQQSTSTLSSTAQPNKHANPAASTAPYAGSSAPRTIASSANGQAAASSPGRSGVLGQLPIHSPRSHGMPIPQNGQTHGGGPKRRGSDSSSEGFREVLGAEKLYIGGRTANGEEKFFKLGVVRRVRSGDRLSLDRLSL
ncbi:hypothetical protein P8C59_000680 [Phyllachora maydis]|uniref:Uncharacterized protein n=1 Tax=Phyllachora maydis TaxID=1825666 RepID=A0AAD9MBG0_9PEZI|nr:hypothetical protein P8C59_000680 [Phyllachora maydis]